MDPHLCRRCDRLLPATDFQPSRRRIGNWICRDCTRIENRQHYDANRAYIDAFKLAAGCADCGYRAAAVALEFDHLPGSDKLGKVSNIAGCGSLARVKQEIAKCEVVCSNCHAIRTAERGQSAAWWVEWRAGAFDEVVPIDTGRLRLFDESA